MAKKFTRTAIKRARHPRCIWSEDQIEDAVKARFPGRTDVDLEALIDAWLADKSLTRGTLGHCCSLAAKLAEDSPRGQWLNPKKTLERIRQGLQDGAPIPRVNRKARREARRVEELNAAAERAANATP